MLISDPSIGAFVRTTRLVIGTQVRMPWVVAQIPRTAGDLSGVTTSATSLCCESAQKGRARHV